ncbi:phage tail P2-like protein [Brevibacillus aydinogluensis]|uniref:phage tail protein I n=1 Tax=Brevibacillus aydinogluensis TaxID=927786 RepID=UPI002892BAD3|nr:phage tail protein I [Brevibacillus aydinogluensis]MDT3416182.1 phage tail P2-like protein [Brevibacillus aydinogluensis]
MADIYSISLVDILPESLKSDPDVVALAQAITPEIHEVSKAIPLIVLLATLDQQPEEVVDLLAWQFHVDFYEPDLPLEKKRALVREAFPWHRRKGTPWTVEQVVSIVFPGAKVAEWFEYGGEPYHFRVETEGTLAADADLDRLVRLINATKRRSAWLENVTIKRTINAGLNFGGVFAEYRKTEIYPVAFQMPNVNATHSYGGVISYTAKTTINTEVN